MPKAEYRCDECQSLVDIDTRQGDQTYYWCVMCNVITPFTRKWTPPHTGRGSNGEPPR